MKRRLAYVDEDGVELTETPEDFTVYYDFGEFADCLDVDGDNNLVVYNS